MKSMLEPLLMVLLFAGPLAGAMAITLYAYSFVAIFDSDLMEKPAKLWRQQNARRVGHFVMIAATAIMIAVFLTMSQIISQSHS